METENEQALVENEQEESTDIETVEDEVDSIEEADEDTVPMNKTELNRLRRKAIAYDSLKSQPKQAPIKSEAPSSDYMDDVFMVKDLSQSEYQVLKDEAADLGIPFKKYVVSQSGKTLLDKTRSVEKSRNASTDVTSKSPVYKKFSQDDLSKMTAKEMEKILQE